MKGVETQTETKRDELNIDRKRGSRDQHRDGELRKGQKQRERERERERRKKEELRRKNGL